MRNRVLRVVVLTALAGLALQLGAAAAEPIFEARDQRGGCTANANTLCLLGGRFAATLEWRQAGGSQQDATAVALTDDAGYFYFNNPNNIEVVVKMVNACLFNSRFWVFAAGLTNVETELTVAGGGAPNTYDNPLGSAFQPIQDTDAFSSCP